MKDGFIQAFKKGNAITRLSAIILGLGNLAGKQIIKGILYLAIEVSFICFMIFKGINCLAMLPSLEEENSRRYGMRSWVYTSMWQVIIHF